MRNMSFSMTTEAVRRHEKTVTRRLGWWDLKPGTVLQACEKCQGLKKGEKVVKLAVIRVVSVTREPLHYVLDYPESEIAREGFGQMRRRAFMNMFMQANTCWEFTPVNRIEFEYVDNARPGGGEKRGDV